MDKVNKLGSAMGKKLASRKVLGKKNQSSAGTLEQAVKLATAKELRAPDASLNLKVVELIPSAMHTEGDKEVARVLTARLQQKNPHKVLLAITLIREVLKKCHTEIAPARESIMAEVGKVASQPMNRFDSNLSDQQRTKHAAFELLKTYGQDGHILSQPEAVSSPRAGSQPHTPQPGSSPHHGVGGGSNQSLEHLLETVETQTVIASSHNDLLQDMLLDKTSYEDKSNQDRALAKDVILDATKFGQSFEQLLGRLATFDTPESNRAMTNAIEKMDVLNNSLNLHKEMLQKELKGATNRPHGPRRGSASATSQDSGRTGHTPKAQDAGVGNLLELQQGLDVGYPSQQAAPVDPFAASSQWQSPSQQQQPHQPPPGGSWASGPHSQGNAGNEQGAHPAGQNNFGSGQNYPQQAPSGYNPYHQGYGQQWAGPHSGYPPAPQNWGEPQQSLGHGGQQWGGPPYSQPPGPQAWGGPTSSHPHSNPWGQPNPNPGYGYQPWAGPQSSQGHNPQPYGYGNYGPPPYSSGYGQAPVLTHQGSGQHLQEKPAHVPPPILEAVVTAPAKKSPQVSLEKQEEVAASTPLSGGASNGGVTSQYPSPVHPRTPAAGPQAAAMPQSFTSTPAGSPPQIPSKQAAQPPRNDDFGFESNAFPAANAPSQPQQDQAANALPSPPRPSQPPTVTSSSSDPVTKTYESFDAFGQPPSGSTQPAAAKQQNADDDWDLFFSDKQGRASSGAEDGTSKKPVDQLAMAFKEMASKQ